MSVLESIIGINRMANSALRVLAENAAANGLHSVTHKGVTHILVRDLSEDYILSDGEWLAVAKY